MTETVQSKNEYSLETYPEAPKPSDPAYKESRQHVDALKTWAWNVGRHVTYNGHHSDVGMQLIQHARTQQEISDRVFSEMMLSYSSGLNQFSLPPDGIEQVSKMIANYEQYWGRIRAPKWCHLAGETFEKLYLTSIIYGATGRAFPVAFQRTANALGMNWFPVKRFVQFATQPHIHLLEYVTKGQRRYMKKDVLPPLQEGVKYGKYTSVRLSKELWESWKDIRPIPGTEKEPNEYNQRPFAEYLIEQIPWCVNNEAIVPTHGPINDPM